MVKVYLQRRNTKEQRVLVSTHKKRGIANIDANPLKHHIDEVAALYDEVERAEAAKRGITWRTIPYESADYAATIERTRFDAIGNTADRQRIMTKLGGFLLVRNLTEECVIVDNLTQSYQGINTVGRYPTQPIPDPPNPPDGTEMW